MEEALPGLSSGVRDLLCSTPLDAALRLLPLMLPRAEPSLKGDSRTHVYCRVELKGMMEHLPALWLSEIPRKPLPQHIVFNKGISPVLIAAEMCIWVESLEIRH